MSLPGLSSLRRITSNGSYIAEIDGLRFVAIASVLLYHIMMMSGIFSGVFPQPLGLRGVLFDVIRNGDRGVRIFFAISGLVLGLPFARQRLQGHAPIQLKAYLLRRLTRLEPPYIANLLLRLPFVIVLKHMSAQQAATHLAVSLFYADSFVYRAMPALHPPSWSLAVEVQFYLLAPLLAYAIFHENVWVRRLVSIVAIALTSYIAGHLPGLPLAGTWHLSIAEFAQFFLVGMLSADVFLTLQPRLRSSILWDLVCAPLWVALFVLPEAQAVYLMPPMLLILIAGAFLGPVLGSFFRAPVIATLGGMCYSLYLTHSLILQVVYSAVGHLFPHGGFWVLFSFGLAVALPSILLGGIVFFITIERPCMDKNWPAKLLSRVQAQGTRTSTKSPA